MNEKEINRIVEETIHSLDNVKITVPDDILFKKIMENYMPLIRVKHLEDMFSTNLCKPEL